MRRITVFERVTPEGQFAKPGDDVSWFVLDEDLERAGAEQLPGTDTILLGRRTYEMFAKVWPKALEETGPGPHGSPAIGRKSPSMKAMAEFMNAARKVVFSRSLEKAGWANSRIVREFDPLEIGSMKREKGKDMVVLGSGSLVAQLAQHGLVDEYQLVVSPLLLGEGRRLFEGLTRGTQLRLLEARAFPTGNVLLRYAPAG